jgi:hypothetical protein
MKNMNINKIYNIIVLLLFSFIIIPIILYISNVKEGLVPDYTSSSTSSSTSTEVNPINRIKTYSNKYAYCLGGNIMCPSGNLIDISDNYDNTYSYLCDDNKTQAVCTGNITENMSNKEKIDYTVGGISFPFSTSYSGFTTEYSDIPFVNDISNNIYFFKSGDLIKKVNKYELINSGE